ncbi:MAG: tRNA uridine-5-carboxymethylaminomethyl(34) synthesis GTPase MnmE, partial [Clostridia bacterium]|nr:tRNA uridine-5-carboxymethylaminomethyl(34) synthesis GTPase MnmE [Clostridia bacterium]
MTIAAIATANATGGIGIVRLSGEKSIEIANKIFSLDVTSYESHTLHLGKIVHNGKNIDEALVSVFKAPNSYTGENVVEFNCHGGLRVCKMVLEAVCQNGAKPAEPGEFTKRAFLNGKMDLSQAEAVEDLISAETDDEVTVAANQLDRQLSNNINSLRDELIASTSHILAMIDFS